MDQTSPELISDVVARLARLEQSCAALLGGLSALRHQLAGMQSMSKSLSSEDLPLAMPDQSDEAGLQGAEDEPELPGLAPEGLAALQQEVKQATAEARRAEASDLSTNATREPIADADDAARREAVRRAVEEARAELGLPRPSNRFGPASFSVPTEPTDQPAATPVLSDAALQAAARWQAAARSEPTPTSILFEDPVGRIELVRVYAVLSELGCGDEAALLNYTPHNISIGLHSQVKTPTAEELAAAVREVFQRDCQVTSDGIHYAVKLSDMRAPSARW